MLGSAEKLSSLNPYPHAELGDPVGKTWIPHRQHVEKTVKTTHVRLSKTTQ